ncbi:hypothetical protein OIU79_026471 [Salix purpurea]|uniref:Uncharacterized protein n=1 Tax=Salix purpurea TaxID=77065 RepID=A0A9Q1A0R9_SALPP|nr:hypothetical protein OIU79_026471 [Salix purpurea]
MNCYQPFSIPIPYSPKWYIWPLTHERFSPVRRPQAIFIRNAFNFLDPPSPKVFWLATHGAPIN